MILITPPRAQLGLTQTKDRVGKLFSHVVTCAVSELIFGVRSRRESNGPKIRSGNVSVSSQSTRQTCHLSPTRLLVFLTHRLDLFEQTSELQAGLHSSQSNSRELQPSTCQRHRPYQPTSTKSCPLPHRRLSQTASRSQTSTAKMASSICLLLNRCLVPQTGSSVTSQSCGC